MTVYDDAFYQDRDANTRHAARRVLEPLIKNLGTKSIFDVGCGVGTWLSVALECGAERVGGVEGPWLDAAHLLVAPELVRRQDLEKPIAPDAPSDMAICLEVAEHLSNARAPGLVGDLTAISDFVLFGAAIPGQGGDAHINEQWQSWWAGLFDSHGFAALDVVRPTIWNDDDIPFWYRQNTLLYARRGAAVERALALTGPSLLDVVHPAAFLRKSREPGIAASAKLLSQAVRRRLSFGGRER